MAEFTNVLSQTVEVNNNVLFSETVVKPCCKVIHREGSGIFTLKGGRYTVFFGANITGATADIEKRLAIAINGEPLGASQMSYTPATADVFGNVSAMAVIDVPKCCCTTLSIRNIGTNGVVVQNANLILQREDIA